MDAFGACSRGVGVTVALWLRRLRVEATVRHIRHASSHWPWGSVMYQPSQHMFARMSNP